MRSSQRSRLWRTLFTSLFVLLLGGKSQAQTALRSEESSNAERDLIDTACKVVYALLPGDKTCTCDIFNLNAAFNCSYTSPVCVGNLCSQPTVEASWMLLRRTLFFEFCLEDVTRDGEPVNGFCIRIGGVYEPLTPFVAPVQGKTAPKAVATTPTRLTTCTATAGDKTSPCNSCALCNGGTGYTFDCSNLDAALIQSSCTPLSVITSLDPDQDIAFFPHLDS